MFCKKKGQTFTTIMKMVKNLTKYRLRLVFLEEIG